MHKEKREKLVCKLKKEGYIKSIEVEKAFLETSRELFLPEHLKKYAYVDTPLEIGERQTISAPHMVAIMCEALEVKQGQVVLEIGTGSGYHAAVVSKLVGIKGHVYTVERFKSLAENAKKNLKSNFINNITVETGDGSMGLSKFAPYDNIYVTCASPSIPTPLVDQLKDNGKLLLPVGRHVCDLELIQKKDDNITVKSLGGCAFVPLIGKYGH